MQAGKLDSKITIKRFSKIADGFGGFNSTLSTIATVWCNLTQLKGEIKDKFGKRQQDIDIELTMRKKTADLIQLGDVFTLEGETQKYRINDKFEFDLDFYTKLLATKST
jgi:transcription elongation factor GreA-like protein|tara:strand:- start:644 stop:970 length:327 start_codon:yes stop_codon:yes gene_type:complete